MRKINNNEYAIDYNDIQSTIMNISFTIYSLLKQS